ncbi:MAG: baseplate J/gp47 family protein [Candidatus Dormibacteraeota bacterium]|nr:baseplate J/gp47 family protein [Candidatus Dormibacteraeota bacterium]
MATNPIYVETEEEVPEVVERLRRFNGDDTMLVLPIRSRVGQSRFNFQLLRNYASRMGKRVTVVCDDPAVQKMASESGFPVFGAVGVHGEGIPSEPEALPPPRRWWERGRNAPITRIGIAPPTKLITKSATELKPGRFLLYVAAATLLVVGLFAITVYVPSASVTLVAQAQPFSQKAVEIQAQPGKPPIRVRTTVISRSNSQGFKTTGLIQVLLAPAFGTVVYTNNLSQPNCPRAGCTSPGLVLLRGQRLDDTQDSIVFAQTTNTYQGGVLVPWSGPNGPGTAQASVIAVTPGVTGNVGSGVITKIESNPYDPGLSVTNPQATSGGTDASSKPVMTVSDFDAARAVLEQELRQAIAQQIVAAGKPSEKLSDSMIFGPPAFSTDHQPADSVAAFNGTMTLQGEGDFYVDADVHKAFETYLAQRVPNNQQLLTDSAIQVDYRLLSATKGGNLTFVGDTSAFVAPKLDMDKIRSQIVGRPLAQARFFLQSLNVKSLSIKEQPIALPLMPLLGSRISIHYVVEQGAVPSLTTPTTSPAPTASP